MDDDECTSRVRNIWEVQQNLPVRVQTRVHVLLQVLARDNPEHIYPMLRNIASGLEMALPRPDFGHGV